MRWLLVVGAMLPGIAGAQGYCEAGTRIAVARDLVWLAERNPVSVMESLSREGAQAAVHARVMEVRRDWNSGRLQEASSAATTAVAAASGQPTRSAVEATDAIRQSCRAGDTLIIPARQPELVARLCDFGRSIIIADQTAVCALRR